MPGMRYAPLAAVPVLAALLALAACDQPKWRDKSAPAPQATVEPDSGGAPKPRTIPADPRATPAAPAWAQALVGKSLREVFPKTGICRGNTDIVQKTYAGAPAGVQIHGWAWDTGRKVRVEHVVLVDKSMKIVAGGEGGISRSDVPTALPEVTDPKTGWNVDAPVAAGALDAYGVVGDDTICVLGHIEF